LIIDETTPNKLHFDLKAKPIYSYNNKDSSKINLKNFNSTVVIFGILLEYGEKYPMKSNSLDFIDYFRYASLGLSALRIPQKGISILLQLGFKYSTCSFSQPMLYSHYAYFGPDTNKIKKLSFFSINLGYSIGIKFTNDLLFTVGANADLGIFYLLNDKTFNQEELDFITFQKENDLNKINISFNNAITANAGLLLRLKRAFINLVYEYSIMKNIKAHGIKIGISIPIGMNKI